MPQQATPHARLNRTRSATLPATAVAALTVTGMTASLLGPALLAVPPAASAASVSALTASSAASSEPFAQDAFRRGADIGFHDTDRTGAARVLRDDLDGALAAQVEFVQSSTSNPTGNSAAELPSVVAQRTALLLVTPHEATTGVTVEVRVKGDLKGTLTLDHPNLLPAADQTYDARGTVGYSRRAWSAQLPWQWVQPGMTLDVRDAAGSTGTLAQVDVGAPTEIVINNIQLGMLTHAPDSTNHRFIKQPANGATDYFQTLPVSRMTMAQYEKVRLDKVIVANGKIYTERSDGEGNVYGGDMRENVGKAQVSTGINLATWGITSSPMNQSQPGITNQRVIHHSAGVYTNGRHDHGLSGGNGMATLYGSVGNELSHELGHSYGLGHFPGTNNNATGDDRIRMASHHMDSGWGWIAYRQRMRSNLSPNAYREVVGINGNDFRENLAGKYNFNTDTMSGGWDASDLSDYTHVTGYSQKRMQSSLRTLVHDTSYPSGYRAWDNASGAWVDAKVKDPTFNRPAPKKVGGTVFTLLGGYNPANPEQTVLYPAFRSNYGVTFDLPQSDPTAVSTTRSCWLQVDFADAPTQYVTLDAGNGVKQLNVNVAEDEEPTGARVACRQDGVTTELGDPITIATDLAPMKAAVVVGQEAGFETLRAEELGALDAVLVAKADDAAPILDAGRMTVLQGWSDDLSLLSKTARTVAEKILRAAQRGSDLAAHVAENADALASAETSTARDRLVDWMRAEGDADSATTLLPTGQKVTVDGGKCLTLDTTDADAPFVRATTSASLCTGAENEKWWVDTAGRIHPAVRPDLCVRAATPVAVVPCSTTDGSQRWILQSDGHVVRSTDTNSALDLYRSNHRPGLYSRSNGSNQVWRGLTVSANGLLSHLDGVGLAGLWASGGPRVDGAYSTPLSASGWLTAPSTATAAGSDPFWGTPVSAEADFGDGWTTEPFELPEGVTTFRTRGAGMGTTVAGTATARVDTIAPTSQARIGISRVALTGEDDGSGLDHLEYRFGDEGWSTYRASVRLPVAKRASFQHRAVDVAGNVSEPVTLDPATQEVALSARLRTTSGQLQHGTSALLDVTATLPDGYAVADGDKPASGAVRLTLPGGKVVQKRLDEGRATLRIPADVPAGTHRLKFVHDDDSRFMDSARTLTLKVAKAPSTLKASVKGKSKKPAFTATKKKVTMTVSVTSTRGVTTTGKVSVKVQRVRVSASGAKRFTTVKTLRGTLKKGTVKLTLPKSMRNRPGTYRLTLTHAGSANVAKAKKKTVEVRVR